MTTPRVEAPVLSGLTLAALFLVLTVDDGGEETVRGALGTLPALIDEVSSLDPAAGLTAVVGVGSQAYDRVLGGTRPVALHTFEPIEGVRHRAPSTPGDLLFHLRAARTDLVFELEARILERLAGAVTVVDEVAGFGYFDERNLLGFVDGTANPTGAEAAAAVLIGEEDPAFTGGSYVIVQKYLHDLTAWEALPVAEQERVIGRSKVADVEMPEDVKPIDSHVAATTLLDERGGERQILRRNMPFGRPGSGEFGTYFIGYAADPSTTEQMLINMFVGRPEGTYDRILDFSTAVTGTLFFVPSPHQLATLAPPNETPAPRDGSLGIGSLKSLLGKVTS